MKKFGILLLLLALLTACDGVGTRSRHYAQRPEDRSGGPAAEVDDAMDSLGDAARDAGRAIEKGARDVGSAMEDGIEDAGRAIRDGAADMERSAQRAGDRLMEDADRTGYGPGRPMDRPQGFRGMLDAARVPG